MAGNNRSTDTRGMPGGKLAWVAVGTFVVVIVGALVWGSFATSDIDSTPNEGQQPSILERESTSSPLAAPSPEDVDDGRGNPNNPVATEQ